jgi:hypothetical protein
MRPRIRWSLFSLFPIICTLLVLISGSTALLWLVQEQQSRANAADVGDVVGPPSLPAATVDSIFARLGSPMVGTGQVVEQAARQANIDDAFALGVWWTETNDGEAGVGLADRNPGSIRGSPDYPSAYDGYTIYPSYAAAIFDWFKLLQMRYISRGLTSVYTICYPYVGTSNSLLWANKVVNLITHYQDEVPPPRPTPIVTPTLSPQFLSHKQTLPQAKIAQQYVQSQQGQQQELPKWPGHFSTSPQPGQPAHIATSALLPRSVELLLVVFGLLAAIVIALMSTRLGRSVSLEQPTPVTTALPDLGSVPSLPPLFVNQYSPVRETAPLGEPHTSGLLFPIEPGMRSYAGSTHTTEALPRRVTLLPAREEKHTTSERVSDAGLVPILAESSTRRRVLSRHGSRLVPLPEKELHPGRETSINLLTNR